MFRRNDSRCEASPEAEAARSTPSDLTTTGRPFYMLDTAVAQAPESARKGRATSCSPAAGDDEGERSAPPLGELATSPMSEHFSGMPTVGRQCLDLTQSGHCAFGHRTLTSIRWFSSLESRASSTTALSCSAWPRSVHRRCSTGAFAVQPSTHRQSVPAARASGGEKSRGIALCVGD